jgi:hypothetical protein
MPPKLSVLNEISKWASNAERNLNSPDMPDDIADLRKKTLYDFSLLKLLTNRAIRNHKGRKGLNLLAGELAVAVSSVVESGETEPLSYMEQNVRESIRTLFG